MRLTTLIRRFAIAALTVLLAACGTNPYSLPRVESGEPSYEEPASQPAPTPEQPGRSQPEPPSTATGSLIDKASAAREAGDYEQALAYLERAQRIDPDSAQVYLGLAQTHAAAGNSSQSKATAERGLLYCSGQSQCNALRSYTR